MAPLVLKLDSTIQTSGKKKTSASTTMAAPISQWASRGTERAPVASGCGCSSGALACDGAPGQYSRPTPTTMAVSNTAMAEP